MIGQHHKRITGKELFSLPESPESGQLFVWHDVEEVGDPEHCFPPLYGPYWVLERVMEPEPHVFEHDDHELHVLQVQSAERS